MSRCIFLLYSPRATNDGRRTRPGEEEDKNKKKQGQFSVLPLLPDIPINSTYRWYNHPHKQYKQRARTRPKTGMLIVNTSSTCDVCLETYSWTTLAMRPYVILCGHTFCLSCLRSTRNRRCPLCRRSFSDIKPIKLFGDPPNGNQQREMEPAQQLVRAWALGMPPEQLEEVLREVDGWLRDRSDDSCMPLRQMRAAMESFVRLRDANGELTREVEELRGKVGRERERVLEVERWV
ncbi:hypothetical protein B0H34DRAFT_489644 [Crassisporium funariophilum]|nr:hypothetical protein B0H34DRAFT_489644 [Crassisporium funariophilum]